MRSAVGPENFFHFGLTASEVYETKARGYRPGDYLASNLSSFAMSSMVWRPASSRATSRACFILWLILCDRRIRTCYLPTISHTLTVRIESVRRIPTAMLGPRMSILNTAPYGLLFVEDRAIREYCADIWKCTSARNRRSESRGIVTASRLQLQNLKLESCLISS